MRKMAEVVTIGPIEKHPNADTLSIASVHGWKVIIRTGEFSEGDTAVFFQQDAWVPIELAPFLCKETEKTYEGVVGAKIRAIKLRGVVSNGLILPVSILGSLMYHIGDDVSDVLGVKKWEPQSQLQGSIPRGNFPHFIRKTDQERIESCYKDLQKHLDEKFNIELKMDGSSITIFHNDGDVGVCSRNLSLKTDYEDSTFVSTAKKTGLLEILPLSGFNIAIQGELCGNGIQKNIHRINGHTIFVFDIWDIGRQEYMEPAEREETIRLLRDLGANIETVPVIAETVDLRANGLDEIPSMKKFVDRSYENTSIIEGMVFKSRESNFSFKVINDRYLLKVDK